MDEDIGKIIASCIYLNNDAKIEMSQDALYTPTGNKTEVAMLNFLYQNNIEAHSKLSERQNLGEIKCVIPFTPERKT